MKETKFHRTFTLAILLQYLVNVIKMHFKMALQIRYFGKKQKASLEILRKDTAIAYLREKSPQGHLETQNGAPR